MSAPLVRWPAARYVLGVRGTALLIASVCALAVAATACQRAGELIPGESTPAARSAATGTPTPVVAPILSPGGVGLGGAALQRSPGEAISDAELAASVVQIQIFDSPDGLVTPLRNGAGVVVDTDQRLVLTSYVLADPFHADGTRAYTTIAIAVSDAPGRRPSLAYEAEIVAARRDFGLIVLRVARHYRGAPLGPGEFTLPAVTVGDSSLLERGDGIRPFGYPGLDAADAEAPLAVTTAAVAVTGFRGDVDIDGRAWLKMDTRLPYGHGGGPVFDEQGLLIGIAAQLAYAAGEPVAQVRPIGLAAGMLEDARRAGPEAVYVPPLLQPFGLHATIETEVDGIVVGSPAFASDVVEGPGVMDLFDYARIFPARLDALHYEYATQGIPEGAIVEERWYLDGALQDSVSTASTWVGGRFGIVSDRLQAAGAQGIPRGIWRLEIWVDDVLRASADARVGIGTPSEPEVGAFAFASAADEEQQPGASPSSAAPQLLGFFDYEDAAGVRLLRWIVFRDGRVIYQSPLLPWAGGDSGTWWVGYAGAIDAGFWEIEVYFDNLWAGADGVQVF